MIFGDIRSDPGRGASGVARAERQRGVRKRAVGWASIAVLGLGLAGFIPGAHAAPVAASRAARVAELRADLLSGRSATQVLGEWCAALRLADPPRIRAVRAPGVDKPADAGTRRLLGAGPDETIAYRRVDLTCGTHVLSRADNWYRPAILGADMNWRLETSDAPFGQVVAPLDFHRRALGVRRLAGRGDGILEVRALLISGRGTPFSLVRETYSNALLATPHPAARGDSPRP